MNQSDHDILVSQLVSHIEGGGYSYIQADIHGYDQPLKVWWNNNPDKKFIPDVTAISNDGVFHVFEVETSDTITGEHTENQWKLFSAHAKSKNGVFIIFVESGYENEAKEQVRNLGINAHVW